MKVVCNTHGCGFCTSLGFCTKDIIFISGGRCNKIYDSKGNIKSDWNAPIKPQEKKEERIKEIIDEDE